MQTLCGIPYVTLEGTQADWQTILERVERIPEFGDEPREWAGMLRVILQRFVRAFEEDGRQQDMKFWERIVHEEAKSGERFISGWMSAFCAWDAQGKYFGGRDRQPSSWGIDPPPAWVHGLTFDGVWFPRVSAPPRGYAEVDVKVITEAEELDCSMLAGHTSISFGGAGLDTINMEPQWFIYVKGEKGEPP
ncbi:hypothetical protein H0H81_008957 [Sphagnurus paluster]|uniref:Uncharacterized protein n=1 Tax=Sphagnurus paluster TaxID=117069 RepID=A0A9P7FUL2_9AGAR|nr:hypothetical protein H0H81_008957 [Sphagnurus paluster]